MNAEELYPLVSEAIRRAETLDDLGAPGASSAYLDVSLLEEKIAQVLPTSDPEGALARRGAVRAALSAREFGRARQLVERYLAEDESPPELRGNLLDLEQQVDRASSARFPHVSERYGFVAIRYLAQALVQQQAPFPIA